VDRGTEQVTCIKTLNNVLKRRLVNCGKPYTRMSCELLVSGVNEEKTKFLMSENEFVSYTVLNWMGLKLSDTYTKKNSRIMRILRVEKIKCQNLGLVMINSSKAALIFLSPRIVVSHLVTCHFANLPLGIKLVLLNLL
jgi:hypothetical protein